jgi:hypothetical protein
MLPIIGLIGQSIAGITGINTNRGLDLEVFLEVISATFI